MTGGVAAACIEVTAINTRAKLHLKQRHNPRNPKNGKTDVSNEVGDEAHGPGQSKTPSSVQFATEQARVF